jgi:pyruvate/2-oxoacid:ferredoxin oxidoreductase alpha subunit
MGMPAPCRGDKHQRIKEPILKDMQMITGNHAAAMAAVLAGRANRSGRGFCSGVYPITPSTECMEYLCLQDIDKGSVVKVESEHSAMAVCIGASAAGARSFTTTGGNGLIYMAENVTVAAMLRLPVVMAVGNRAVGPPWNIWTDHSDSIALRDSGWIQIYCLNNQEVFDSVLMAFRIAEDHRVLLPAMVCQEGFVLTHTMTLTEIAVQEQVDRFLPPLTLPHRLADIPRALGSFDSSRMIEGHREQHHAALENVGEVYALAQAEFGKVFGRRPPDPVSTYRTEDAELVLVSMGTIAETANRVVDNLRDAGPKVGSVRVTMFRPFPSDALKKAFSGISRIAVIDRDISFGFGGALWGEVRALAEPGAMVQNFITGLGGGDVRPGHIEKMVYDALERKAAGPPVFVGVGE